MARRRVNGEGTIYRRKDGRYEAATYLQTSSGTRRRVRVYGQTWGEAHEKLITAKAEGQRGVPVPDRSWKLDDYLDYWLDHVAHGSRRPSTYMQYQWVVARFLKPALGKYRLDRLAVATVQNWLDKTFAQGASAHRIRLIRTVLSAALTRAQREELVQRNVARLVELPSYEAKERSPWSADEATRFLAAVVDHELYPAFLALMLYGLRRGELLGLRWGDLDFEQGTLHVRNQLQRHGSFMQGPVKTRASQRDLPMLQPVRDALLNMRTVRTDVSANELVFVGGLGQPLDPDSFRVTFQRLAKRNGIRMIAVHDVRHTTATLLKDLGVPARDAQLILGHADIATTQQIYQHAGMESRQKALERVESVLIQPQPVVRVRSGEDVAFAGRCRQIEDCRQNGEFGMTATRLLTSVESGTPGEIRTHDLWYRKSNHLTVYDRITEVISAVKRAERKWLVGAVAVRTAVNFWQSPLGRVALVPIVDLGAIPSFSDRTRVGQRSLVSRAGLTEV
jgi:integrase